MSLSLSVYDKGIGAESYAVFAIAYFADFTVLVYIMDLVSTVSCVRFSVSQVEVVIFAVQTFSKPLLQWNKKKD